MRSSPQAPAHCGVCGQAAASAIACGRCAAPHHRDCWDFNQGCSIFGCGGADTVAFDPQQLTTTGIQISETSHPPLRVGPILQGLQRKFRARIGFVRGTLPAGLGGALIAIAGLRLFIQGGPEEWTIPCALLLTGGLFGFAAPFLAPTQLRSPWRLIASGGVSLMAAAAVLDSMSIHSPIVLLPLVAFFGGSLVIASSAAEVIAGHRTHLGRRLGGWGPLVRGLLAWATMSLATCCAILVSQGNWNTIHFILAHVVKLCLAFGLMGSAVAVPAMEQGKRSFLLAIAPEEEAE